MFYTPLNFTIGYHTSNKIQLGKIFTEGPLCNKYNTNNEKKHGPLGLDLS